MASPGAGRPVISFDEAMQNALERVKDRDPNMPNKYDVEVFLRFPFEGESHYKQSYPAPPIDATVCLPPSVLFVCFLTLAAPSPWNPS
eukprot:3180448-Rhodomonas_salina.1